jgi:hypothetical protein
VIGRNAFLFGGSADKDAKPVLLNDIYALDLQGIFVDKIQFFSFEN